MSRLSISALVRWAEHHLFGVAGQVAAAAPVVLVTMIISHQVGLELAGKFVVAAGIAAVLFTAASLGLGAYVIVERFQRFAASDFMMTRAVSSVFASIAMFALAPLIALPVMLAAVVVLLRLADAAVDMLRGFELVHLPAARAMRHYAVLNVAKLVAIFLPVAGLLVTEAVDPMPFLAVGGLLAATITWGWLFFRARQLMPRGVKGAGRVSFALIRSTAWFAVGTVVVAVTSNSPRILADRLFSGDFLGIVGVSLSFATLLGMVFLSSWLRWYPRLSKDGNNGWLRARFVGESFILAMIVVGASLTFLPYLVSILFGFDYGPYAGTVRTVLVAYTTFMFGMNVTNLFKVTSRVWRESLACLLAVFAATLSVVAYPALSIQGFLVVAGGIMFSTTVVILLFERPKSFTGEAT